MTKNKICENCQYDHYPLCYGTIMENGLYMNIENIRAGFECGQKDILELKDFSIKIKSDLELKVDELEEKIRVLEEVKE